MYSCITLTLFNTEIYLVFSTFFYFRILYANIDGNPDEHYWRSTCGIHVIFFLATFFRNCADCTFYLVAAVAIFSIFLERTLQAQKLSNLKDWDCPFGVKLLISVQIVNKELIRLVIIYSVQLSYNFARCETKMINNNFFTSLSRHLKQHLLLVALIWVLKVVVIFSNAVQYREALNMIRWCYNLLGNNMFVSHV